MIKKSIPVENKSTSPEEAKIVLMEEQKKRAEACAMEVNTVLKKHNCDIAIGMLVTKGGNVPQMQVVAL